MSFDPRGPQQIPGILNDRGTQVAPPAAGQSGGDHGGIFTTGFGEGQVDPALARAASGNRNANTFIEGIGWGTSTDVNGVAPVTTPTGGAGGGSASSSSYATPAAAQASTLRPYDPLQVDDDRYDFLDGIKLKNNENGGSSATYVPSSTGAAGGSTGSGGVQEQPPQTRIVNTPSGPQEVIVNRSDAAQGTTYEAQSTAALRQSINDQNSADFNDPRRGAF